jgi:hypothetical protein
MAQQTASSLQARLAQLQKELAAESRSMNTAATLSAFVGVVILAILVGYFYFGYSMIEDTTRPEKIVGAAQTIISEKLPEARQSVEAEITKSAPAWAENLSKQAISSMPTAREKLRDYALDRMEAAISDASLVSEDEFRAFLSKNHGELERKFQELSTDDKLADASLTELEGLVEAQLKTNMTSQSSEYLAVLKSLVTKLQKLGHSTGLTHEEQKQRQMLMIARAIQEKYVGDPTQPLTMTPSDTGTPKRKMGAAKLDSKVGDDNKDAAPAKPDEKAAAPAKAETKG